MASHPRLRTSCDACNAAKVKCSKEPTRCRRCERRGLLCMYSVSLRSIKRAAPDAGPAMTPARTVTTATTTPSPPVFDFGADGHLASALLDDMFSVNALSDFVSTPNMQQDAQQHFGLPQQHTPSNAHSHEPPSCGCQQAVLSKLSELSLASTCSLGLPFDRALSENRSAMMLCKSVLDCSRCGHNDRALLLLTLTALIAHVLSVLDQLLLARSDPLLRPEPKERDTCQCQHASSHPPVRLSLGSYELDQADEQVLQTNLCRMELDKISTLIDAFERRLSGRESTHSKGANQAKLQHAAVLFLKQALRSNIESVNRLAHAREYSGL